MSYLMNLSYEELYLYSFIICLIGCWLFQLAHEDENIQIFGWFGLIPGLNTGIAFVYILIGLLCCIQLIIALPALFKQRKTFQSIDEKYNKKK